MSTLSQAHANEPRIDWTLVRTSLCSLTALALHVCMYVCMYAYTLLAYYNALL